VTPSLAVQALAVFTLALLFALLARTAAAQRAILITATVGVAALPLLAFAPSWTPGPAPAELLGTLQVLQEPGVSAMPTPLAAAQSVSSSVWVQIWAVGALLALLRLGVSAGFAHWLRVTSSARIGDVARNERITVPLVVGFLRPLILLPPSADGWSQSQRALVLAHERVHARGRDNLWLLLARLVACAHWFNPLAWMAATRLRSACEHHADTAVVASGASRTDYADTLIAVARERVPSMSMAMARMSGLEGRIRRVLDDETPRGGLLARGLGTGLVAAVVVAIGTASATSPPLAAGVPMAVSPQGEFTAVLEAEADRLVAEVEPAALVLIALDARTGQVLGQAERGQIAERELVPGSVIKPFTVAAALELGVPSTHAFADGDMASILERSSNIGAVQIGKRTGSPALHNVLARVGLPQDQRLPIERLAIGDGVVATPEQVAQAWTHLSGHGAIAPDVAAAVRQMLVQAVRGPEATGRRAAIDGVSIAGKTGSSPLIREDGTAHPTALLASFVGLVPAEDPNWVILVSVADPRGPSWGGVVAAPAFRRIVATLDSDLAD